MLIKINLNSLFQLLFQWLVVIHLEVGLAEPIRKIILLRIVSALYRATTEADMHVSSMENFESCVMYECVCQRVANAAELVVSSFRIILSLKYC